MCLFYRTNQADSCRNSKLHTLEPNHTHYVFFHDDTDESGVASVDFASALADEISTGSKRSGQLP